jgi:hypothetical protein
MENMKATQKEFVKTLALQAAMLIGVSTPFWGRNSFSPMTLNSFCNRETRNLVASGGQAALSKPTEFLDMIWHCKLPVLQFRATYGQLPTAESAALAALSVRPQLLTSVAGCQL